mmetsp:Transcript_4393/g.6371  ORF Transcript_4393/g.6371 Transcript_4393/m.6371 type:complete len:88 (+) Transcript_4393:1919-2182(+)
MPGAPKGPAGKVDLEGKPFLETFGSQEIQEGSQRSQAKGGLKLPENPQASTDKKKNDATKKFMEKRTQSSANLKRGGDVSPFDKAKG